MRWRSGIRRGRGLLERKTKENEREGEGKGRRGERVRREGKER